MFEAGNFLFFFPVQLADSGAEVLKPPRHAPKVFLFVRNHATGAVLDAAFRVLQAAAAALAKGVERAEAEQTVEVLRIVRLVARKIFAFLVLEKFITHIYSSLSITLTPIPTASGPV